MARKHGADVIMSSCHSDIIMSSPVFIQMSKYCCLLCMHKCPVYRCEITYLDVSNKCPVVHFSNVTTVGE